MATGANDPAARPDVVEVGFSVVTEPDVVVDLATALVVVSWASCPLEPPHEAVTSNVPTATNRAARRRRPGKI
jgi:hypothetical protein